MEKQSPQLGLTLVELVVTLAVLSLLMSVALPSFQSFTVRNNSIAEIDDLKVDLRFARNEAAKVGAVTRICIGNSTGCHSGWGNNWARGWIVKVNATGTVLKIHPPLLAGDNLTAINNSTRFNAVDFNRYGFTSRRLFRLCDGQSRARAIILSRTGRVRMAVDTDTPANGLVDDENDNDISCS